MGVFYAMLPPGKLKIPQTILLTSAVGAIIKKYADELWVICFV